MQQKVLTIKIPGASALALKHLVLDYNGTLAEDGELLPGIRQRLDKLSSQLSIHVITADTHGTVREKLSGIDTHVEIIGPERQDLQKAGYIEKIDPESVVAIGNGRNDGLMLAKAKIGIGVIQKEGCAAKAFQAADIICADIGDALDLLIYTDRLRATLRN